MNTLDPDEAASLRRTIRTHNSRSALPSWSAIRLLLGPLDGLTLRLDPAHARSRYLGIGHLTTEGLVQIIYRQTSPGVFRFDSFDWPRTIGDRMPPNPFDVSPKVAPDNEALEN